MNESLTADFAQREVPSGTTLTITATVSDPEGDALAFDWQIVAENAYRKEGGDRKAGLFSTCGTARAGRVLIICRFS